MGKWTQDIRGVSKTHFAMLRSTKISPGIELVIKDSGTRESEQPNQSTCNIQSVSNPVPSTRRSSSRVDLPWAFEVARGSGRSGRLWRSSI